MTQSLKPPAAPEGGPAAADRPTAGPRSASAAPGGSPARQSPLAFSPQASPQATTAQPGALLAASDRRGPLVSDGSKYEIPPGVVTGEDAIKYFASGALRPELILYCNPARCVWALLKAQEGKALRLPEEEKEEGC